MSDARFIKGALQECAEVFVREGRQEDLSRGSNNTEGTGQRPGSDGTSSTYWSLDVKVRYLVCVIGVSCCSSCKAKSVATVGLL